jgi:hypothetical protein
MAVVSLAVGFGGIAAAQAQMGNESGKGMSGAAPGATASGTMQQKGAGPSGASSSDKTMSPSGGPAGAKLGKKQQAEPASRPKPQ